MIAYWTRHKYLVMAHHVPSYQQLGRLLADAGRRPLDELANLGNEPAMQMGENC